ncbi:MAG: hypothetical protein WDO15_05610 [Bacteroidota bacterium]
MLKKIVRKVFVFGALYFAWACVDQNSDGLSNQPAAKISVLNGRVKFADQATFFETVKSFDGMDSEHQLKWASSLGHNTLQSAIDRYNIGGEDIPKEYQTYSYYGIAQKLFLNDKGFVQIGDDVILYKEQKKYYMTEAEYGALGDPLDIMKSEKQGDYKITVMANQNDDPNARSWNAPTDGNYGDGGDMHEFQLGDGSWRKFTTVFIAHSDFVGWVGLCTADPANLPPYYLFNNDLQLMLKLEGRVSKKKSWSHAAENRDVAWNINFPGLGLNGYDDCGGNQLEYVNINLAKSGSASTGALADYYVSIVPTFQSTGTGSPYLWSGTVTGTVDHTYPGFSMYELTF